MAWHGAVDIIPSIDWYRFPRTLTYFTKTTCKWWAIIVVVLSAPLPTSDLGVHHLTVFVSPCDQAAPAALTTANRTERKHHLLHSITMANTSLRENTPSMTVNGKGKGCSTAHSSSAGTVHILYSLTLPYLQYLEAGTQPRQSHRRGRYACQVDGRWLVLQGCTSSTTVPTVMNAIAAVYPLRGATASGKVRSL